MTLYELAAITGGTVIGDGTLAVHRIATDSRGLGVGDGDLFVALRGENHDGHQYITPLVTRGVRLFLVSDSAVAMQNDGNFVVVDNTLTALRRLAEHHRAEFRGEVIAITGSYGKTIVKEWIAALCPEKYRVFRSPRSYNSQVGVPLSLLMIEGNETLAVIEAGISKPGEMEQLRELIQPGIGVLTNLGEEHGENFRSAEEKLAEKCRLLRGCRKIVYDADDARIAEYVTRNFPQTTRYGICTGSRKIRHAEGEFAVDLKALKMTDRASVQNALTAIAAICAAGVPYKEVVARLGQLMPIEMRLEMREGTNGCTIVNDTYNSDINSLQPALNYMCSVSGDTRRVVILSDIEQNGADEAARYRKVAELLQENQIDRLIGVGERIHHFRELFSCAKEFFLTTDAAVQALHKQPLHGATILIKGGRDWHFNELSRSLERKIHTTVMEVNLDSMAYNLNRLRHRLRPGVKVVAMVKAFSYGMGTHEVAAMLENQHIDYLAVAFADEGVTLRESGIRLPIVVLNADSWSFPQMIAYRLEPEIYSLSSLRMFIEEARKAGCREYPIHLKLDTGMHRLGCQPDELDPVLDRIASDDTVVIRSVFSHFATSDDPTEDDFTHEQLRRFRAMTDKVLARFPNRQILRHIANSAAIERFPEAQFDMVRLGLGLYGYSFNGDKSLRPVCTLRSKIVQIKQIAPGETIGYGRHGRALKPMTTATVPIGYADGLDRRLSRGNWSFWVNGAAAPIVGNICMDTCMIDVTGLSVNEGDAVEIFGVHNPVLAMADKLQTIVYEILTGISQRVKRIYVRE